MASKEEERKLFAAKIVDKNSLASEDGDETEGLVGMGLIIFHQLALQNEVRNMALLRHDSLIHLHEVYRDESSYILILDLMEGGSLNDLLETRESLHLAEI